MDGTTAGLRKVPPIAVTALGVVVVMIVGLAVMAAGLLDSDREEAAVTEVIEAISAESAAVTNGYLAGPESLAEVVAQTVEQDPQDRNLTPLLRHLTLSQSNVDGAYVGYPDGSFVDVRWSAEDPDRLLVKTIENNERGRAVQLEVIDTRGEQILTSEQPDDTYDPRTRPWYAGASSGDNHWTDPYVFFTSNEPGITHSVPVVDGSGELIAIVGVDIRLASLNEFLADRQPSDNGGAAVLNASGELVAGNTQLLSDPAGQALVQVLLAGAGPDVATQRLLGDEPRVVAAEHVGTGDIQLLIVEAPESDFLSDVRSTRQGFATLAGVLGVVGILLLGLGTWVMMRYLRTLDWLASTDQLTGLMNRTAVQDHVNATLDSGRNVAVMTLDLDDFKLVNDEFGHDGGDRALIQAAKRLRETAPDNALVGRLGGDEFCLVLIDSPDAAQQYESIVSKTAGTVDIGKHVFDLNISAGFVVGGPGGPPTAVLFQQADVAMYEAKTQPGTAIVEFDSTMDLRWRRDDERRDVLINAIDNDQFTVFFQPEFDLVNNTVVGAEVLLRWDHPTRGVLTAIDFIHDLERFDLLPKLVPMLFSEAERLVEALGSADTFRMRINVSASQLLCPVLAAELERVTSTSSIRWCFEANEQSLGRLTPRARSMVEDFRRMGVEVAIDNFGTGQSSIYELQLLPIDAIKIAPVFVQSLDDTNAHSSLSAVLVDLAEVLGIDVIAEGIEHECQRNALVEAGCTTGAGFLLGEPVRAGMFARNWASRRPQRTA